MKARIYRYSNHARVKMKFKRNSSVLVGVI